MVEPLEQPQATRAERKERTRRALLDGTLELLADRSFSGLSLREVARTAGIVPTAFYRHFASLEDLGVALAEESMRVARRTLREARRAAGALTVGASLDALDGQVQAHPREFRYLVRERHGGTPEVRRAIDSELRAFVGELAIDLARNPALDSWETHDLETAAELFTLVAIDAVPALLEPQRQGARSRSAALDGTAERLRIVALGMTARVSRR